jgi:DNA-binding PadR family transcriptional regulator
MRTQKHAKAPGGGSQDAPPSRRQARYAVLAILSFGDELTGYAIRRRVGISFRYFFGELAHSQVYRELRQLEELGWVSARDSGAQGGAGRSYRISAAGLEELRAWAHSAQFDPPTLRFPIALKIWLGHLTGPQELQDALLRQQRYVDEMLDKIGRIERGAGTEPRYRYPELVNRWSRRIWEATRDATAELIDELAKLEAPPRARRTPGRRKRS